MKFDITISGTIGWSVTGDYIRYKLSTMKNKRVDVVICSLGGYITDGLDIYQQFREHGDVHAHFVGMSASAATVLAMGCKTVDMVKNSLILIHNSSNYVYAYGSYNKEQLDGLIDNLGKTRSQLATIDEVIASVYSDRNGKTVAENMEKMKVAAWIKSADALAMGLVDSVRNDVDEDEKAQAMVRNSVQPYNNDYLTGLGLPLLPEKEEENPTQESLLQKAVHLLQGLVPSNNNTATKNTEMIKTFIAVAALLAVDGFSVNKGENIELSQEQMKAIDDKLRELQDSINTKDVEIGNLKEKAPATDEDGAKRIHDLEEKLKNAQEEIKTKDEQIANLQGSSSPEDDKQPDGCSVEPRELYNMI